MDGADLENLKRERKDLVKQVKSAQVSPGFDSLELTQMKKRKLLLKEAIEQLETQSPGSGMDAMFGHGVPKGFAIG